MSSYLDISIERFKDGKWVNLLNCSSSEELETVNLYKLRDTFVDCEYYDSYATTENISEESIHNFATKIRRDGYFGNIQKGSKLWPYDKQCRSTSSAASNAISELKALSEDSRFKFCDITVLLKNKTFEYGTPYAAMQDLKYNPELKDLAQEVANGCVIYVNRYFNDQNEEVYQFQIPSNTYISTYKNLKAFEHELENELAQVEETRSDKNRLRSLLISEIAELSPEDLKGPLGKIVKRITKNRDWSDYSKEYIDSLKDSLDELRFLIHLVGENGRIIWNIS